MSLTVRLLLLVALAILPALLIEAYNEYSLRQTRAAEVQAQSVRLGEQTAAELRQIVEGIQRVAVTLAQVPPINDAAAGSAPPDVCAATLVKIRREYPGNLEVGIANAEGQVICTSRGTTAGGRVRGSHFRRAIETGGFVIGGYGAGSGTDRYLSFAYPLRNDAGQSTGAVLLGLDLNWLSEHMRQRYVGIDAVVGVADRDLTYLLRLPDDATKLVGKPTPPEQRYLADLAGKGAIEAKGPDGVTRVGVIVPLSMSPDVGGKPDLLVAFGLSKDAAFQPIDAATTRAVVLLGLSLMLALLSAYFGGRYFVHRPVERLLAASNRWRDGDYSVRLNSGTGGTEFARLSAAFDRMAAKIEEREHALQASEERFRSLASLVPAFIWFGDADGNIHYLNERWYRYTGQCLDEALGTGWSKAIHPSDVDRTLSVWHDARERGVLYEVEVRYRNKDGAYRWFLARAEPLRDDGGEITGWFGSSTDIDAIKRADQHRALLVNELNHRVKNTLATVQSIAIQSLRGSEPERARDAFEARLLALSRTHDVLTRENWEGAALDEIIIEAVRPFRRDEEDRFHLTGPSIRLPPRMVLPLSMCLQELLTNAVKYGALSMDTGQVAITWSVEGDDGATRLKLRWIESGGPAVAEPSCKGFGSRLIERSLARELGGYAHIQYETAGVVCSLDVPLPSVTSDNAASIEVAAA